MKTTYISITFQMVQPQLQTMQKNTKRLAKSTKDRGSHWVGVLKKRQSGILGNDQEKKFKEVSTNATQNMYEVFIVFGVNLLVDNQKMLRIENFLAFVCIFTQLRLIVLVQSGIFRPLPKSLRTVIYPTLQSTCMNRFSFLWLISLSLLIT